MQTSKRLYSKRNNIYVCDSLNLNISPSTLNLCMLTQGLQHINLPQHGSILPLNITSVSFPSSCITVAHPHIHTQHLCKSDVANRFSTKIMNSPSAAAAGWKHCSKKVTPPWPGQDQSPHLMLRVHMSFPGVEIIHLIYLYASSPDQIA